MKGELFERWKEAIRNGCEGRVKLRTIANGECKMCALGELYVLMSKTDDRVVFTDYPEGGASTFRYYVNDDEQVDWATFGSSLGINSPTDLAAVNDIYHFTVTRRLAVLRWLNTPGNVTIED